MGDVFTDEEMERMLATVRKRRSMVGELIQASENVCAKLEHPTESVTIMDQERLRKAVNSLSGVLIFGLADDV